MTATPTNVLSDQARALAAVIAVADQHPHLPSGYLTCHSDGRPTVLLSHPSEFEAWRSALLVEPEAVALGSLSGKAKLSLSTTASGVPLHIWVTFPLAAPEGVAA
jgi:hypothetical protein